jgi:alpha-L-fucosidase
MYKISASKRGKQCPLFLRGKFFLFLLLIFLNGFSQSKISPDSIRPKMQWFADAKLGIFIHWGIYSVKGIDESWSFFNKKISWPDYMTQLNGFTASAYDPEAWASLVKESGARYAVMTTKHHDGVALWDTKEQHFDVVDNTPAKRDLLSPFYAAIRKKGIKAGAYFSLIDWSHPDYPGFMKDSTRYKIADDPARWKSFFFNRRSVKLAKC